MSTVGRDDDDDECSIENGPDEPEAVKCACSQSVAYEGWILKRPDDNRCPLPCTDLVEGVNATLKCLFTVSSPKPRYRKSGENTHNCDNVDH